MFQKVKFLTCKQFGHLQYMICIQNICPRLVSCLFGSSFSRPSRGRWIRGRSFVGRKESSLWWEIPWYFQRWRRELWWISIVRCCDRRWGLSLGWKLSRRNERDESIYNLNFKHVVIKNELREQKKYPFVWHKKCFL